MFDLDENIDRQRRYILIYKYPGIATTTLKTQAAQWFYNGLISKQIHRYHRDDIDMLIRKSSISTVQVLEIRFFA